MEFINYTRHDTTSKTKIKTIKKNKEYKGIGSYIEVEVLKKGHKSVIKIPFFNTYKNNFIDVNGTNYLNKKAKKVVRKVVLKNIPEFNLNDCVTNAINDVNKQISELGITGEEIRKKFKLEYYRDNILNNAKENDSEIIVKSEITYLNDFINKGLNFKECKTIKDKTEKTKDYLDKYEYLETLKAQVKKFKWSQKRGLSKLNNKITKRIGAISLAALLGFGAYEFTGIKDIFKGKEDNSNKSKVTVEPKDESNQKDFEPINNKESEKTTDNQESFKPTTKEIEEPTIFTESAKYDIKSDAIIESYEFNLNAFNSNLDTINNRNYDYNFEEVVYGYTFVEHPTEIKNINANEVQNYINAARTLISILIEKGEINKIPLESNTFNVINNCLNGDIETAMEFVRNAKENDVALLDMLTVGEELGFLLNGDTLYNFNAEVYFKEINEFFNSLTKSEVNKVLKLNI